MTKIHLNVTDVVLFKGVILNNDTVRPLDVAPPLPPSPFRFIPVIGSLLHDRHISWSCQAMTFVADKLIH